MHMYMYVVTSTSQCESCHVSIPNESKWGESNMRNNAPITEYAGLLASCHARAQDVPNDNFTNTCEDH